MCINCGYKSRSRVHALGKCNVRVDTNRRQRVAEKRRQEEKERRRFTPLAPASAEEDHMLEAAE